MDNKDEVKRYNNGLSDEDVDARYLCEDQRRAKKCECDDITCTVGFCEYGITCDYLKQHINICSKCYLPSSGIKTYDVLICMHCIYDIQSKTKYDNLNILNEIKNEIKSDNISSKYLLTH